MLRRHIWASRNHVSYIRRPDPLRRVKLQLRPNTKLQSAIDVVDAGRRERRSGPLRPAKVLPAPTLRRRWACRVRCSKARQPRSILETPAQIRTTSRRRHQGFKTPRSLQHFYAQYRRPVRDRFRTMPVAADAGRCFAVMSE